VKHLFNSDNVTVWDENADESVLKEGVENGGNENENDSAVNNNRPDNETENPTLEEGEAGVDHRPTLPPPTSGFDVRFYVSFWGLQTYLSNPNSVPDHFHDFKIDLDRTLEAFGSLSAREAVTATLPHSSSSSSNQSNTNSDSSSNYSTSAKYLTSPRLLNLQMRDPLFRRHLCVQFLVLLDYLVSPHLEQRRGTSQAFSAVQKEELGRRRERIEQLLRETVPDGAGFVRLYQETFLPAEVAWSQWKMEKCPALGSKLDITLSDIFTVAAEAKEKPRKRTRKNYEMPLAEWTVTDTVDITYIPPHKVRETMLEDFVSDEEEMDADNDGNEARKKKVVFHLPDANTRLINLRLLWEQSSPARLGLKAFGYEHVATALRAVTVGKEEELADAGESQVTVASPMQVE